MTDSKRSRQILGAVEAEENTAAPPVLSSPVLSSNDLIDFVTDHAQQLAALALTAGRPQASALLTLAVTQLRQPG